MGCTTCCWAHLAAISLLSLSFAAPVPRTVAAEREATGGGYGRIQFVGFPIQTGYNDFVGPNELIMPDNGNFGVYVGLEDARADMTGRMAIMQAAIDAAMGIPQLDPSPSTLKIFMAPEFFWRGPTGAYGVDDPSLLELGDRLKNMVAAEKFKDWLFVFGSVIGAKAYEAHDKGHAEAAGGKTVFDTYNFAVIQRGNSTERHTHFKTHISGIDFLQDVPNRADAVVYSNMRLNTQELNQTISFNGTEYHIPLTKDNIDMRYSALPVEQRPAFERRLGDTVNGSFSMAGLDFCLDLCLDHALGVCAQQLDQEKARGGRGEVDVQLVVSAGMSIVPENTRTPMGGSVLLCDGLSSGAQQLIRKFGDRQLGGALFTHTFRYRSSLHKSMSQSTHRKCSKLPA